MTKDAKPKASPVKPLLKRNTTESRFNRVSKVIELKAERALRKMKVLIKEALNLKRNTGQKGMNLIILLLALLIGLYFKWGMLDIIIFLVFVSIILWPVSSRIMAIPALGFLIAVPFLLMFRENETMETLAEQSAIYAYYFIVMTVIMGIYEVRKKNKTEQN